MPETPLSIARIREVLDGAVADRVVTPEQADELARRLDAPCGPRAGSPGSGSRERGPLAEVAGYAGGALVLGAAALFLGTAWSDLGDGARAGVLLVAGGLLLAAGAAVVAVSGRSPRILRDDPDSARRRLVSTLWSLAAAAAAGGVGVLVDDDAPLAAAAVGLVVAAATYRLVPGAPGHLVAAAAAATVTGSAVDKLTDSSGGASFAVAFVGLGLAWALSTAGRLLGERDLGYGVAGLTAVVGAQLPVIGPGPEGLGYALTAAVAVAGYGGYLAVRSWPVLAAGVVATTLVVPEALHDWTDGSVSVAGALLVAGLTLLGASAAGLRLRKVTS